MWGATICNLLLILQKPPAPVALQGRLCLSAKPHEYKRSLVWLNLPPPTKLGKTQGESSHRSQSPISSGDWGSPPSNLPSTQNFSLNKYRNS